MRQRQKSCKEMNLDDVRSVVDALLSGASLSRVPETMHPKLLVPLCAAKNEAIVAGQAQKIKQIQSILQKLKLSQGQKSDKKTNTASQNRSPAKSASQNEEEDEKIEDGDYDTMIDKIIEGKSPNAIIRDDDVEKAIPVVKKRIRNNTEEGDFRTCQKLENLLKELNTRNLLRNYNYIKDERLASLKIQKEKAQDDLKKANAYYKQQTAEFNKAYKENKEAMEQEHKEQLEEFDGSFPEVLPVNFWKVSPQVLQLREQEKHCVHSHMFEEAIPYHERADQLELDELDEQRKKFLKAFHAQRQQLINVQQNQKECFEKNWNRKRDTFHSEAQQQLNSLRLLIANLKRKIEMLENEGGGYDVPGVNNNRSKSKYTSRSLPLGKNVIRSPVSVNPRVRSVAASRLSRRPYTRRL